MSTGVGAGIGVGFSPLKGVNLKYATSDYCEGTGEFSPTVATPSGGVFTDNSLDPNVFQVNSTTGVFNLGLSDPGNYIVTYTVDGKSADFPINITALDDASFSYSSNVYTPTDADPTPTITGLTGGTFSGSAGLVINSTTGEIDLSASTEANHTVTYTTSGNCPNSSTQTLTIVVVVANNYSMNFDGVNDYINSGLTLGSTDFTFSCWVKHSGNFSGNFQNITYHSLVSNNSNFTGFLMYHTSGTNLVLRGLSNGTADGTTQIGTGWNHIAGVFNNTSGSLIYYLNGQPEITTTIAQNSFNTRVIEIGKLATGNYVSNYTAWNGSIDEYAIWDTALTSTQVSLIYNATSTNLTKDLTTVSGSNLKYWNRMGD